MKKIGLYTLTATLLAVPAMAGTQVSTQEVIETQDGKTVVTKEVTMTPQEEVTRVVTVTKGKSLHIPPMEGETLELPLRHGGILVLKGETAKLKASETSWAYYAPTAPYVTEDGTVVFVENGRFERTVLANENVNIQ